MLLSAMRRRTLTDTDRRVWASYTQHVAPHRVERAPVDPNPSLQTADAPSLAPPIPHTTVSKPGASPPPIARRLAPIEIGTSPGGVDRSTWTRFRGGKLAPQRTLDLHGRTVQRAHADLHIFIQNAMSERLRCVEVITGRGTGESGGVLRREVPLWLNGPALRPVVLAASHPHPANQGAIRLLLRRIR